MHVGHFNRIVGRISGKRLFPVPNQPPTLSPMGENESNTSILLEIYHTARVGSVFVYQPRKGAER